MCCMRISSRFILQLRLPLKIRICRIHKHPHLLEWQGSYSIPARTWQGMHSTVDLSHNSHDDYFTFRLLHIVTVIAVGYCCACTTMCRMKVDGKKNANAETEIKKTHTQKCQSLWSKLSFLVSFLAVMSVMCCRSQCGRSLIIFIYFFSVGFWVIHALHAHNFNVYAIA